MTPVDHPKAVPLYLLAVEYKDVTKGAHAAAAPAPIMVNITCNINILLKFGLEIK